MTHLEKPVLVEHLSNVDAPFVFQAIPCQAEHLQAAIAGQALSQHLSPRGLQAATGGDPCPKKICQKCAFRCTSACVLLHQ